MAMGKIEKICSVMIMLGAEEIEFKTAVNDKLEKQVETLKAEQVQKASPKKKTSQKKK